MRLSDFDISKYREVLLEHSNHPTHKGKMKNPDFTNTSTNESCGDEITLYLKIKDGRVTDASWTGKGCAITKASADILCCTILAENSDNVYLDGVAEYLPGRVKCVETAYNSLRGAPPFVLLPLMVPGPF